jgi:short-subunit dehydrogenase
MGASSGIGLELARKLAGAGMRVGVAARSTAKLKELKEEFPGQVEYETVDVIAEDAPRLTGTLIARLGGMDTYVHVAGVGFSNEELDPALEMATLDVNVTGFARMVGYAFRYFRDRNGGKGHIVAVTSVAGTNGIGNLASYSASKCFDQCYLRALEQLCTLQKLRIRITDVRPGWVETPLLEENGHYSMLMKVPYVADRIARAARQGRRVAVIDWRWNLLAGLWRLIPNRLWVKLPVRAGALASKP